MSDFGSLNDIRDDLHKACASLEHAGYLARKPDFSENTRTMLRKVRDFAASASAKIDQILTSQETTIPPVTVDRQTVLREDSA